MSKLFINPIGKVFVNDEETYLKIDSTHIPALKGLDGFSHLNVFWWFDGYDDEQHRSIQQVSPPYKGAPTNIGVFATRSPKRPNPIALSVSQITGIDYENGIIKLAYIDAHNNSPLIDIKPYFPNSDRVENPEVPKWCNQWPKSLEESVDFDWDNERIFKKYDMIRK